MNGNHAPIVATVTEASAGYARSRESDGGPRQRPVLDRVDLEICSGELLAVLGRNGSGKTTLLRLLAGTLRPLTGSVELFGRPIGQWPRGELARRVAVLPQSRELPRGFTVSELVAMGRIPHARSLFGWGSEDEQAVERALADADASDLAHRPISELSGGERQRVVVAMALAQEPALLLLDEPTLHLDVRYQVELARTLRRLCDARGVTVVAVLHDLNLAAAYADRCVLLDAGRLVPAGSEAGRIDAGRLGRALGIVVEEAATADGRRVLATVSTPPPGDPAA